MRLKNTNSQYGGVTKFFHWMVFLFFVNQYIVAKVMVNLGSGDEFIGFTGNNLYNWHKSIGLILLGLALLRLTWRRTTRLPDWDASLGDWEKKAIHWIENALYFYMIAMPVSGYLFVMAGGFGVDFFGQWQMPNPIGTREGLAQLSKWTHIILGWAILITVSFHLFLGIRQSGVHKNGYLRRMLPFTSQ